MDIKLFDEALPALTRDPLGLDTRGLTNAGESRAILKSLRALPTRPLSQHASVPSEARLTNASTAQRAQAKAAAAKEAEYAKQRDASDYTKYQLLTPAKMFPDVSAWRRRLIVPASTPAQQKEYLQCYVDCYITVLERLGRDTTPFPLADKNLALYLVELTRLAELIDVIYDVLDANSTHLQFVMSDVAWLATQFNANLQFHASFAVAGRRLLRLYYEQQAERPLKLCRTWWLLICRLRHISGRMLAAHPDVDVRHFACLATNLYTDMRVRDYLVGTAAANDDTTRCSIVLRCDYEFFGPGSVDATEGEPLGHRPCDKKSPAATALAEEARRQQSALSRDRARDTSRLPSAALAEIGDAILGKPVAQLRVRELLHLLTRLHCYWRDVVWAAEVEMLVLQLWRHFNRFLFDVSDETQALMAGQSMYVDREEVTLSAPPPPRVSDDLGLEFDAPAEEVPRERKITVHVLGEQTIGICEAKLPHHLWAIQHKWRYSVMVYHNVGWAPHQYFPVGLIDGVSRGSIDVTDAFVQTRENNNVGDAASAVPPEGVSPESMLHYENRKGATAPCALSDADMAAAYTGLQAHVYTGDAAQKGARHEVRAAAYRSYLRPGEHCQFRQENPVLNRAPIDVLRAYRTKDEFTHFASFVQLDRVVELALAAAFNQWTDADVELGGTQKPGAEAAAPFVQPQPREAPYLSQAPALEGHVLFTLLRLHYLASDTAAGHGHDDAYCQELRNVINDPRAGAVSSALETVNRQRRQFIDARYAAALITGSSRKRIKPTAPTTRIPSEPLLDKTTVAMAAGASERALVLQDAHYDRIGLPPGAIEVESWRPQLVYIRGEYWVIHLPHAMVVTRNAAAALAAYVRRCAYIAPTCYNMLLPPGLVKAFSRHAELAAAMRIQCK